MMLQRMLQVVLTVNKLGLMNTFLGPPLLFVMRRAGLESAVLTSLKKARKCHNNSGGMIMCRKEPSAHMEAHVLEAAYGISSRLDSPSPPLHILHNIWVRFLGYVCVRPHLVQEHPTPTIRLRAESHVPGVPASFGCWRGPSVHPAFPHASMVLSRNWRTLAIAELFAHDCCHIDQCVCS